MTHLGMVNLPGDEEELFCGCGNALDENGSCPECGPGEPDPDEPYDEEAASEEAQNRYEAWLGRERL